MGKSYVSDKRFIPPRTSEKVYVYYRRITIEGG